MQIQVEGGGCFHFGGHYNDVNLPSGHYNDVILPSGHYNDVILPSGHYFSLHVGHLIAIEM